MIESGNAESIRRGGGTGRLKAIKSVLRGRIDDGEYTAGKRLPSERQLCDEFETSRVTLHEILIQLETDGLIYREDRRGWFVSPTRFVYNPQSRGHFQMSASEQGRKPGTVVIDKAIVVPPPIVRELLDLGPDQELARIRRVRSINERSILYVEHYCIPEVFPGLFDHDLSVSMTELYREVYGFHYGRMKYRIMPTAVTGEAAGFLRVSNGSPALLVARVNHSIDERVRDCDLEYWRHDAVLIEVDVEAG
ncbi:DNA-binding GntR family transcriptional regulator [Rhizobium azooxidifex]|uniref:DNA-binding GntR family transcriptional regulator n=1 Tax=Mycoplana azooxidifex TaxID=1636188 RepID=A0A7W6GM88_9HYPH|nr:UTRA domain-containing protein [Mycoplana azooxidifex]MBB3980192.1 DNA-binding GntR family transcriptional regulator [Mycoplana azooxidifex]